MTDVADITWLNLGVMLFLGTSILFYALFGGADFGAGILELFAGRKQTPEQTRAQRELISHAMAPVWEANHMWLVLSVVILFMGYPAAYTTISTYLHLPLMAILVGIVARGCAFTFRHYDPYEPRSYRLYTLVFAASSAWTAFFLGATAGALMLGRVDPLAPDFFGLYVAPWWNLFCAATGLFAATLFAFLAAVFLTGEAEEEGLRRVFLRKSQIASVAMVGAGALVFLAAGKYGHPLAKNFLAHPISQGAGLLATILLIPFWWSLAQPRRTVLARTLGGALVALVMFGWFAVQFPYALRMIGPAGELTGISLVTAASPPATMKALLAALLFGSLLIFPALFYLLKIFKWETFERERGGW